MIARRRLSTEFLRTRNPVMAIAVRRCFDGCAIMAAAGLLASLPAGAQTARNWNGVAPLPSGPAGQPLAAGSTSLRQPQVVSGRFDPYAVNGTTATIRQTDAAGILRWGSFDIAPGYRVQIEQPSASAVLLNKVDGGAFDNKTVIDGMLNGKGGGQIYIYNPNGIIFGKSSRVDVGSLFASTLKIDDNRFLAGLLAPNKQPIFSIDSSIPAAKMSSILVEGDASGQAVIAAVRGGKIVLIAPTVTNQGILSAPDGQVALAAGGSVYLASPSDLGMRGLLVEVNNSNLNGGSTVTNDSLGKILVERGNASLVGLAVNQKGTVSATTSVAMNGSIYLRARDGASKSDPNEAAIATNGGQLVLGAGSVTAVTPTLDDKTSTTPLTTAFNPSVIELSGKSIHVLEGASVEAKGGKISLVAKSTGFSNSTISTQSDARIYLEAGSRIDASGTTSDLPMESNLLEVELRGNELADVPLQRDSVFRGKKVTIDVRKGTPLGNVSGYLALLEQNVGQRTAAGGTVNLSSEGDVIVSRGASVDVSGGQVNFRSGYVATTQLTSLGRVIDIGSATPDLIYDGVVAATPGQRNFEAGYSQGSSAGSIFLNAPYLVMRGELRGAATPGPRQRDTSAADFPKGGMLVIGSDQRVISADLAKYTTFNYLGRVDFGGTTTANIAVPNFADAWDTANAGHQLLKSTLDVDNSALSAGGFASINAYTQGDILVSKALDLRAAGLAGQDRGGEFRLGAQNAIQIDADVRTPGGVIEGLSAAGRLSVAPSVRLDVAGLWTNDRGTEPPPRDGLGNPTSPLVKSGGSISLTGQTMAIGAGATFDASGGAWQDGSGKMSAGSGGGIALVAAGDGSNTNPRSAQLTLGTGIDFLAYGLAGGGTLKLTGRDVTLGARAADARDLGLAPEFFQRGGFAKYDITAQGDLTVAADATIQPRMDNWVARRNTAMSSGGRMSDAFDIGTLDLAGAPRTRGVSSLSLTALAEAVPDAGRLWLQSGAKIETDPGGTVSLRAGRQLTVDGSVITKGGSISALLYQNLADADASYRKERGIWLGSNSLLDARGSAEFVWSDSSGLSQGSVLDGGKVQLAGIDKTGTILSARGYVVTESGSQIKVDGTEKSMSFGAGRGGAATRTVASAGGSIDIRASEGLLLEGGFSAAGGNGSTAGGDGRVAGGSLSLTLDRGTAVAASGYPTDERNLTVLRVKPNSGTPAEGIVPPGLQANQAMEGLAGKGYVLADALSKGQFDRMSLKSQDVLGFDAGGTSLALSPGASLILDAPLFRVANLAPDANLNLSSAYVRVGNSDWKYQAAAGANSPTSGNGTFAVTAGTIDLIGKSVLQGTGTTRFSATGDVRLVGQVAIDLARTPDPEPPVIHANGEFSAAGAMSFTASQVYPTTMSEFTLNTSGAGNSITFNRTGADPAAPLSAAGRLTVNADTIDQFGVLRAPFGSIELNALNGAGALNYRAGSVTSVAGGGSVPFGRVSNGRDWLYDFGNGNVVAINSSATNGVSLPQKKIHSNARSLNIGSGAVLDLSGGGDLYAYEFTPGPGGSRDVLAPTKDKDGKAVPIGTFAVIPGFAGAVAPVDFQYQQDGGLLPGDRIYLSGIPGLSAGYYTLLPAHYALLPGAYSVSAISGIRDMTSAGNYAKTDGSWVVAGYRGSAVANPSRWGGFLVSSGSQVRDQSEFSDSSANAFFAASSSFLPRDGGHSIFEATRDLVLRGAVRLSAAAGGKKGIADISASDIAVVADSSQSAGSAIKLNSTDLVALGADSLLLGGTREFRTDGVHMTAKASSVTLDNDAAHPLTGPELILAATDTVTVTGQSVILNTGTPAASGGNLLIQGTGSDANGALLRVSAGSKVDVVRNSPTRTTGTLDIKAGATIGARADVAAGIVDTMSATTDATAVLQNQGTLTLGSAGALGIGSNRISFGNSLPDQVEGLRLDGAALSALNSIADISLTSYSTFDLYGSAVLGHPAIGTQARTRSLSLHGSGVQAYGAADSSLQIAADLVRFDNAGNSAFVAAPAIGASLAPVAADGSLGKFKVTTRDFEVGNGRVAAKGIKAVDLTAEREFRATGKAGVLASDKAITVAAGRVTALSGADASIKTDGALVLNAVAQADPPQTTDAIGGTLSFEGRSIVSKAMIVANSGRIKLQANGPDGVHVSGGEINASGYSRTFGSTTAYAPAGTITLDGGSGNVTVDAGATLDVSAVGADAGVLAVVASNGGGSKAVLNGNMKGSATAGRDGTMPKQGNFRLDVDVIASLGDEQKIGLTPGQIAEQEAQLVATRFGATNAALNDGGFTEARQIRVRNGDVTLASGDSIKAHELSIAVDNGNLAVGGWLNASGTKGGSIELYAAAANAVSEKGRVKILPTARLDAFATQSASTAAGSMGDGGRIVIGTSFVDGSQPTTATGGASIAIDAGARFNVAGLGAGQDGSILLRAPRLENGADVAISATDSNTLTNATAIRDASTDAVLRNGDLAVEAYKVYHSSGDVSIGTAADAADNSVLKVAETTGAVATGSKLYKDADDFLSSTNLGDMRTRLGGTVAFRAGVEVRSDGRINVSVNEGANVADPKNRGWNLNAWRFGNQPGILTLRASNDLTVNGSISDGFAKPSSSTTKQAMPDWTLDPTGGASWSYRLVGGGDLSSANPLATKASDAAGDVILGFARSTGTANDQPVALIRTGSGRIDIAAGRDVTLGTLNGGTANALGATIYTAGRHVATQASDTSLPDYSPNLPKKQTFNSSYATGTVATTAEFAQGGGAISISASRDITGPATSQLINNWLFRRGRTKTDATGATVFDSVGFGSNAETQQTAWWSRYDYFNQGIATFGGGDISVVAERGNVIDLSASVATNGQVGAPDNDPAKKLNIGALVERGGGDLRISAGGDIRGGAYFVQKGQGYLRATGSVTSSDHTVTTNAGDVVALRPVVALGDAGMSVVANGDVQIETAFNPTLTRQSGTNAVAVSNVGIFTTSTQYGYYSTYGQNSGVRLTALNGNVLLGNNSAALLAASGTAISTPLSSDPVDYKTEAMFKLYPGNLDIASLKGDIRYEHGFTLAPAAQGRLNLLAGGSVRADTSEAVIMSDIDPAKLPGVLSPRALSVAGDMDLLTYAKSTDGIQFHTSTGTHGTDTEPVRVVALSGDIKGDVNAPFSMILPKRAEILAGRDIADFGFKIQQLDASDVTRIVAGRDFVDSTSPVSRTAVTHQVSGPGRVDIEATRNFDLGNGRGLVTRGNLDNSYLPDQGASINLVAGARADYAAFFKQYVVPADLSAAEQTALIAYVRQRKPALPATLDAGAAIDALNSMPAVDTSAFFESRKPVLNDLFFVKARAAAKNADGSLAKDLGKFDSIIAALYPARSIGGGDVNVFGSQLKTERGGGIDVFAPGGSVFAGLAQQPTWLTSLLSLTPAVAAELGVTTIRGGEIQSLVKTDFLVNQGRVFTLGGGDITLVSQYGNIDAGKGAKTAVSAPPPVIKTDSKGNTVVDISTSISGSGIATLRTGPEVPASGVFPVAPRGIFDAGDAGVRSTGTVEVVASTVLNANNIAAAGSVSGAKTADTSGLGGAVATPAAAPATKAEGFAKAATPDPSLATNLTVELIGIGPGEIQKNVTQDGQNGSRAGGGDDENRPSPQ